MKPESQQKGLKKKKKKTDAFLPLLLLTDAAGNVAEKVI